MAGILDFNRIRAGFAVAIALGLVAVLAPATAAAADAYVNDTGHTGAPCTLPSPCNSINTGIGQASAGATVHIDGGAYNEAVTLSAGKSLIEDDFDSADVGPNQVTINGGTLPAIDVEFSNAGAIRGLTINSDDSFPVFLNKAATFTQNAVNSNPATMGVAIVYVSGSAAGSVISGNTITGSTASGVQQTGIDVAAATATVSGNTIVDASQGITAESGTNPVISGNTISGTHTAGSSGVGIVVVPSAHATIAGNLIHLPGTDSDGIEVSGNGTASPTGATLARNSVIGAFTNGIKVDDSTDATSLDSDLVTGATNGIVAQDDSPFSDGGGDVSMRNVTVWGNSTDLSASRANLTIDSSLVEDPVSVSGAPGDVACAITFSRGPTTTPGDDGCGNFQTTAAPTFAGPSDFHLTDTPGNRAAFIDHGNPAGTAGSLDLDGLPRRIDADGACPLSQIIDMGAYEFQVAQPDCAPPPTSSGSGQPPVQPKKCKKKSKKRGAAAQAKKKKCKRRK